MDGYKTKEIRPDAVAMSSMSADALRQCLSRAWDRIEELEAREDQLEHRIAAAYQRGVHWWIENGKNADSTEFVPKAAYDYADKIVSTLKE